jgi:gas vesicle protein
MHYQNDIIKYKMRIKELENNTPGKDKEKEFTTKIQKLKDQHEREKENLKSEMQQ